MERKKSLKKRRFLLLEKLLMEAMPLNDIYEQHYKDKIGKGLFDIVSTSISNVDVRVWMRWALSKENYKILKRWLGEGNNPSDFIDSVEEVKRNPEFIEKFNELKNAIAIYIKLKNKNQLPNFEEWENVADINSFTIETFLSYAEEVLKPYSNAVIHSFQKFVVFEPKSFEASYLHVQNTSICTKNRTTFEDYMSKDQLYIIREKKGKVLGSGVYQIHFESDQYKDKLDRPFNLNMLAVDKELMKYFRTLVLNEKIKRFSRESSSIIGNKIIINLTQFSSACHFFANPDIHMKLNSFLDFTNRQIFRDNVWTYRERYISGNKKMIFYYFEIVPGKLIMTESENDRHGKEISFSDYLDLVGNFIYENFENEKELELKNGWRYIEEELSLKDILVWLRDNISRPMGIESIEKANDFEQLTKKGVTLIDPRQNEYFIEKTYGKIFKNGKRIGIKDFFKEIPIEVLHETASKRYDKIKIISGKELKDNVGYVKTIKLNGLSFLFKFPKIARKISEKVGNEDLQIFNGSQIKTIFRQKNQRYDFVSLNNDALHYVAKYTSDGQRIAKDELFAHYASMLRDSKIFKEFSETFSKANELIVSTMTLLEKESIAERIQIISDILKNSSLDIANAIVEIKKETGNEELVEGITFFLADKLSNEDMKKIGYSDDDIENLKRNNNIYVKKFEKYNIRLDKLNEVRSTKEGLQSILVKNIPGVDRNLVSAIMHDLVDEGDYLEMKYYITKIQNLTEPEPLMSVEVWRTVKDANGMVKKDYSSAYHNQSGAMKSILGIIDVLHLASEK